MVRHQAEFNGIGKSMMDSMAKESARRQFRHCHFEFTTPKSGPLDREMQAYARNDHPKMTWLETVEAQETTICPSTKATTLINNTATS